MPHLPNFRAFINESLPNRVAKSRFSAPFISVDQLAEATIVSILLAEMYWLFWQIFVSFIKLGKYRGLVQYRYIQLRLAAAYGYKLLGSDICMRCCDNTTILMLVNLA